MLELFGRNYVIEHCVSEFERFQADEAFRIYLTDTLKVLVENGTHYLTAKGFVDYGKTINRRWFEIMNPPEEVEEDNRTISEVVDAIWSKIEG